MVLQGLLVWKVQSLIFCKQMFFTLYYVAKNQTNVIELLIAN